MDNKAVIRKFFLKFFAFATICYLFSCNQGPNFDLKSNSLSIIEKNCNDIVKKFTIKNNSDHTVLLLNVSAPIVSRENSKTIIGYYFSETFLDDLRREGNDLSGSVLFAYPGQEFKLGGEQLNNLGPVRDLKISIGYQRMNGKRSSEAGVKLSSNLSKVQTIEEFSLNCKI